MQRGMGRDSRYIDLVWPPNHLRCTGLPDLGTWWAVPCFVIYGVLYGSVSDSRWHEPGHRTAFKTVWMNDVIYEIASFMVFRESVPWRWSHVRHHTDTIIVGRDRESPSAPGPVCGGAAGFLSLQRVPRNSLRWFAIASGGSQRKMRRIFRSRNGAKCFAMRVIYLLIYAAVIAWAIAIRQHSSLDVHWAARLYGYWLATIFGLTQHAGLAEDVLDHRLNTRTVYMNPILRFLYWEMNYHVEHHIFPWCPTMPWPNCTRK